MKVDNHPFDHLTLEEKSKIPVNYLKLEKAPLAFQRSATSKFHRTEALNCHTFHKPISQILIHQDDK
jgi:hypothetical protein